MTESADQGAQPGDGMDDSLPYAERADEVVEEPTALDAQAQAEPDSPPDPERRVERLRTGRDRRRPLVIAAAVVGALLLMGVAFIGWRMYVASTQAPPSKVVVIGESRSEDGAVVAGLVAIVDLSTGEPVVTPVDAGAPRAVPGTSFSTIRDALPMGGPALVAKLAAGEDAGWVILTEDAWQAIIDGAGGADLRIPTATTVFTGEDLFRFKAGQQLLSGDQAGALLMGTEALAEPEQRAAVRTELAGALARAVIARPQALIDAVRSDQASAPAQSSMLPEVLGSLFADQ